jgi:hypothetical protein
MINIKLENKQVILTGQILSNILGTQMSHVQSPAVVPLEDRYKIFFCSRKMEDVFEGNFVSKIYSIDLERETFRILENPTGEIVSLGGAGTFDEFGMTPVSAINYLNRLHLYYAGWSRAVSVPYTTAIGVAVETDKNSFKFKRMFNGPVLPYAINEPFLMGSPRVKLFNNKLYMWYVSGTKWDDSSGNPEPVYKIRMASSDCGINWTKTSYNLIEDSINLNECQAAPEVIRYKNGFLMVYSFRSNLRNDPKREYQIGLAYSSDLENWITLPVELHSQAIHENMKGTSYYNLIEDSGIIRVFYQLPGMGKDGIGTAILKIEGQF